MAIKTKPFDASKYLATASARADLLSDALASGDRAYIAVALSHIAKSYSMVKLADDTGLSRTALYKALSEDGNPTLETLVRILPPLGISLDAVVSKAAKPRMASAKKAKAKKAKVSLERA